MHSPITTIPGIGFRMGAMILAKIGDFSRFDSPDKILAYAGMSPSTYQSGQLSLSGAYSHMEKRGSRYLRYALYIATKYGSQSSQSYISPTPSPYYLFTHPRFEEREYKTKNGGCAYFLCATSKTQTFNKFGNEKGGRFCEIFRKICPRKPGSVVQVLPKGHF